MLGMEGGTDEENVFRCIQFVRCISGCRKDMTCVRRNRQVCQGVGFTGNEGSV